jgi:hypothetical protein
MKITKKQKEDMLHALGYPRLNKNWKAHTILKKCYRNRYVDYNKNEDWEELVRKGYAQLEIGKNFDNTLIYFYYVTLKGVELLKELRGEKE